MPMFTALQVSCVKVYKKTVGKTTSRKRTRLQVASVGNAASFSQNTM